MRWCSPPVDIGGVTSPLKKYDQYLKSKGKRSNVEKEEKHLFYQSNVLDKSDWAGLCHAWALASIIEQEPTQPKVANGITFSVADQKALILKSYDKILDGQEYFGERYSGGRSDIDDIGPHEFHAMLMNELGNGRAFIIDHDPELEVWNVPVYEAEIEMREDFEGDRIEVTAYVKTAKSLDVDPNYVGLEVEERIYYYYLYTGPGDNGETIVYNGEWIYESVDDHPDFLIKVNPRKVKTESYNRNIQKSVIREI